ncbi:variable surface family protein [Brachyspira pilosicoli]|uniref:variable surface family protein n=1 Tax=Brachyspira pilosicoli TaxID=52584 RepID=UPI00254343C7|nr:variable surface family protein [Brachyspira pilosicoli]WIH85460.1 variable surface family protein [Brachyspira pilosicoli]
MKKVLLTAIALLTIASTSVFGYYGANSDWIDFLVDANQLRFRVRQMGFVLGNDMIRGVVGVRDESETSFGAIFDSTTYAPNGTTKQFLNFIPTVSAGIGYTSDIFSIGVGYNYRYHHTTFNGLTKNGYGLSEHTPVLTMTAMNDSLRIAIPIQVAVKNADIAAATDGYKYLGVSMDPQIRYYTGIEAFNEIRLYVKYGINQTEATGLSKQKGESFGFDFRAYFGATVGDVALKPFLKVTYDTALGAKGKVAYKLADIANPATGSYSDTYGVKSSSGVLFVDAGAGAGYEHNPWALNILPTLGMSANSDIVSIYVEAGLGYGAVDTGYKFNSANAANTGILHSMRWNAYGEIYINPVKDLQWYFEAEIGNGGGAFTKNTLQFNGATGITWYLPAL